MNHTCLRCLVTGLVQGVWFRSSARIQAQSFGITGYARNLTDGSVEVLACGDDSALVALHDWLHHGPSSARVDSVTCTEVIPPPDLAGFQVH